MLIRQTARQPWNITYDDIVTSLVKAKSRKSRMPGLYGKRDQGKQSVDYLYYCPIKSTDGYHNQTSYTLYAYGLFNRTPAQFNISGMASPLNWGKTRTNKDIKGQETIAKNFQTLKKFSRTIEIEPIACDILLWESSNQDIKKSAASHSQINTLFDAWGVADYLDQAHQPITMQTNTRPAAWKNHTWMCIFQYPETHPDPAKNYAVNLGHCLNIAVGNHDPLHQPIAIVDNEKALTDYRNLFYTSRFFQGNYYRALNVLCSDYVYWVLGDSPAPCISEVITKEAFEPYNSEIQQVPSQAMKSWETFNQAHTITRGCVHRYSFFNRHMAGPTEDLSNNEQIENNHVAIANP